MRELFTIAAIEHDLAGIGALETCEELLVARFAATENDGAHIAGRQYAGQRFEEQVDAFLHRHARNHAEERHASTELELQGAQQELLDARLACQVLGAVVVRQVWIGCGIPFGVVHAVENADDSSAPRSQCTLQSHGRDFEPMNKVVQYRLEMREAQVVAAIVRNEERVATTAAEPRRHIDTQLSLRAERRATQRHLVQRSEAGLRIRKRPAGALVAVALAYGVGAEGISGPHRVERIDDPLAVRTLNDLELVFDPRVGWQVDS